MLAQTIDLSGDLDDQITVLEIARTGSSRRVLMLSFGGLLGYLGLNSDGLTIGLNLVLAGDWRPGLPPYLVIRHLLDTAASVGDAIARSTSTTLAPRDNNRESVRATSVMPSSGCAPMARRSRGGVPGSGKRACDRKGSREGAMGRRLRPCGRLRTARW